jgi:hypothetical protein
MSVRKSNPLVHYPQLNSIRVCWPTSFQKFKCHIFICVSVCVSINAFLSLWSVHIEKGDRRVSEPEIPDLKTWNPEFLNLKKCNSDFPKSELGIPGSWNPKLIQAKSRSPGKWWECNLWVDLTFCFQFEFMSDADIVRNIYYRKRNSMFLLSSLITNF